MRRFLATIAAVLMAAAPVYSQSLSGSSSGTGLINRQVFCTHQTTTPSYNALTNNIVIKLLGAGGGGRAVAVPGSAGTVAVGGPGMGGAYLEKLISGRSSFVGKQLVVGTGGSGGAAASPPNNGTAGTATTFDAAGANYSAGGGPGGTTTQGPATPPWFAGIFGTAATASNGDLNVSSTGANTNTYSATGGNVYTQGGAPAAPQYGSPGVAELSLSSTSTPGGDAFGNGAGGSGSIVFNGSAAQRGGNGTDGCAIIEEYP